jgi:hypothetical protein
MNLVPAIFWAGSGSSPVGNTSLGLYEDDDTFVEDAPKIAAWACSRLGYPVMAIEMTDGQLYDCFEESITEYSAQVNEFNMRENMLVLQGVPTTSNSNFTGKVIQGSPLPFVIELSQAYGTETGTGGKVDWKKGYIDCVAGQQQYDLQQVWGAVSESGNRIEIRRVFHALPPAVSRGGFGYGTGAFGGPGDGQTAVLGEFGWAGYDGGLNAVGGANGAGGVLLMMPIFETLLRTQAIEFNDQVRRSQYSFEIVNNKLKLFPVPSGATRVWFQYSVTKDKFAQQVSGSNSTSTAQNIVSDYSNAPYKNMLYMNINDVGKRWIRRYTLALVKESLGRILSKYENIPIPNSEVRLDGATLRQEAEREKDKLWEQLRETLEQTGRKEQMEKMKENEENSQLILQKVPTFFYIG